MTYETARPNQQGCIKQVKIILETVVCEDYIDIPGAAETQFKMVESTKPHVAILSSKIYTDQYSLQILLF